MFKKTLLDQFVYISECHANKVALRTPTEHISYSDLIAKVASVGSYLRKLGIKPGDRVSLVIENSIDYVISFYAIWKVGGIVVSLNAEAKFPEIEKLLAQCKAKFILMRKTNELIRTQLQDLGVGLLTVGEGGELSENEWQHALSYQDDTLWHASNASTLAQIIYTSGTTGNPKGVLLSHGNLISNVEAIITYLELTAHDSVLNLLPFHYCYGNSVLQTHLSVGAEVVLAGSMAFPQDVVNSMRKYRTSGFYGVPSTYNLFLHRSDWARDPPALRYLAQAGGPMSKALTDKLMSACRPTTLLFIMYGQTEASARITWLPPALINEKLGSAGIPVDGVLLEIRDATGQKLKAGEKGEVYVSGPNIMQGYWDNPEATKRTLIDGWLKTGDLGHLDEDGFLYLEGRSSDMIKVGAHRINPLELEEVINRLEFIAESAVVGVEDEMLGHKLSAYLVGDESNENLFALKKYCKEHLALHKIPREFKWLSQLPKTASGKIKRYQLNGDNEK